MISSFDVVWKLVRMQELSAPSHPHTDLNQNLKNNKISW